MNFGEQLKTIRLDKGLTQRELGKRMNVSQQTIAQFEKAQSAPKSATIIRLAEALGLDDISQLTSFPVPLSFQAMWERRDSEFAQAYIKQFTEGSRDLLDFEKDINKSSPILYELPFPPTDKDMLEQYSLLNDVGKQKVIDYAKDLVKIPEYQAPAHDEPAEQEGSKEK